MPKKKMHFILLFTSIFASLLFLSGCVEEVYVDELVRPDCSVRFIQADESYGNTTFRIYGRFEDSTKVVAEATVGFASASGYFTIPAGARKMEIISSRGTVTTSLTFASYWQTSLILRNGAVSNQWERYVYSDEAHKLDDGAGTKSAIKFRNLMDGAVYCGLDDSYFPSPTTATSHAAGGGTAYITVDRGSHFFEIFTASDYNTTCIGSIGTDYTIGQDYDIAYVSNRQVL
jgi:hypothetical protein